MSSVSDSAWHRRQRQLSGHWLSSNGNEMGNGKSNYVHVHGNLRGLQWTRSMAPLLSQHTSLSRKNSQALGSADLATKLTTFT